MKSLGKIVWRVGSRALMALLFLSALSGCKKEKISTNEEDPVIKLLVFNLGTLSTIDKDKKQVTVTIGDYIDRRSLTAIFQLTDGAIATVNGKTQLSSETSNDFTLPVTYTLTLKGNSSNWTVRMVSNSNEIGLGKEVQAQNRLNRDYDWFRSQDTTGTYAAINGGPACLTMASLWANRLAFGLNSPQKVRDLLATKQLLSSIDMTRYLDSLNISWKLASLSADHSETTDAIDKGYLVIYLADMGSIPFNLLTSQHTDRYYESVPGNRGHYFIVKGYEKVDGNLFYEVYEPYTLSQHYSNNGEIKGRNRYFLADAVYRAALSVYGWKYALIIHEKNGNGSFDGPVKNEISETVKKNLLNPLLILYQYGY